MLKPNIHYIVTKPSDDGTFDVGDHIYLDKDGVIIGRDTGGWIAEEDVEKALKGVEVKVDVEYYEKKKAKLNKELEEISYILEEQKHD